MTETSTELSQTRGKSTAGHSRQHGCDSCIDVERLTASRRRVPATPVPSFKGLPRSRHSLPRVRP